MVDLRKIKGTYANVNGQTVFMNKAASLMGSVMQGTKEGVTVTTGMFFNEVHSNITKSPHTPYQLKKLGHPFASRHGSIQPHGHTPQWSVHAMGGDMASSLKKEVVVHNKNFIFALVGWEATCPDEVKHVVLGTDKMLKRPVLRLTANKMRLREIFFKNLLKYARRDLKGRKNIPGGYREFGIVRSMMKMAS